MRRLASFAFAATMLVGWETHARAESPVSSAMHEYYEGERRSGWLWGSVGVVALGAGTALYLHKTDLTRGMSYPILAVGAIQTAAGVVLLLRTDGQIAKNEERIAASEKTFRDEDLARIKRTNTSFLVLEIVEGVLILGGATLAIVSSSKGSDTWKGVGIGLAIQGAAMLGLDGLASMRSHRYEHALEGITVSVSPAIVGSGTGALVHGTF